MLETNKIYCMDNLELLKSLPSESIDLIYCDILYNTGKKFKDYDDRLGTPQEAIEWYKPRLIEMKRVLKDTGSIYLQCDWHLNSYIRVLCDEIFGFKNFINEIIWHYKTGGKSKKFFARKHDTIFLYAKNFNSMYFNPEDIRIPFTPHKQDKKGENYGGRMGIDENGRPYVEKWGTGKKKLYRYYLDVGKIPEDVWEIEHDQVTIQRIDTLLDELKSCFDNGALVHDVWDTQTIQSAAKERTDYDTQKPKALLERIIKASSSDGDIVADFFMGSGTTCVVAKELGRKYIGCDINPRAIEITNNRLNELEN